MKYSVRLGLSDAKLLTLPGNYYTNIVRLPHESVMSVLTDDITSVNTDMTHKLLLPDSSSAKHSGVQDLIYYSKLHGTYLFQSKKKYSQKCISLVNNSLP